MSAPTKNESDLCAHRSFPYMKPHTEALVQGNIARVLHERFDGEEALLEAACEMLLEDVVDGEGVPENEDVAKARWEQTLVDFDLTPHDEDDAEHTYALLLEAVHDAFANEVNVEELIGDDECELCERVMPITRHHLIPKSEVAYFQKRPPAGFTESGRTFHETAGLCRQCHSFIHQFADERTLGERYNTVELLLEEESIRKFAQFQNKQKNRKGPHVNGMKYAR